MIHFKKSFWKLGGLWLLIDGIPLPGLRSLFVNLSDQAYKTN